MDIKLCKYHYFLCMTLILISHVNIMATYTTIDMHYTLATHSKACVCIVRCRFCICSMDLRSELHPVLMQ